MAKLKVELNKTGIVALLNSPELEAGLKSLADKNAPGDWETDTKYVTGNRPRVVSSIFTTERGAIEEELDTHRLVGGLHG